MGRETISNFPLPFKNSKINRVCSEKKFQKGLQEPFLRCRHVIVFVGFLLYFLLNAYRMNVSVGILAMVNNSAAFQGTKTNSETCPDLQLNASTEENFSLLSEKDGEFAWSPEIQGHILGAYFFGYVISQIPAGRLVERFGCKWFIFGSSLFTAVSTFLIPTLSWLSASALIAVQALRGLAQGIIQPASFALISNWLPKMERGLALSIIASGSSLGACLGSIFSGLLCESFGRWPSAFYTFGALGLVASASVAFFMYESPRDHPRISEAELRHILSNQERALPKRRPELPWSQVLTSVPVYALIYGCFGQMWAFSQFLTVQSTFLGTILHYTIAKNGFFTALTFALQFAIGQLGGWLSSYMLRQKLTSVDFIRKFWNSVACVGFSACQLGVYFAGCNRTLSVIFSILSLGFTGLGFAGCWIVPSDMTPTFAGSLNAICVTVACMSSVIVPLLVGYLTEEMQTIEQWNKIFFITIGVVITSGIVFAVFGSADVQDWNYVEDEKTWNYVEDEKTWNYVEDESTEKKDGDKKTSILKLIK